ncbi:MAG TPA: hypothetical protein VFP52_15775 [Myxococcales bacterium]|nr:hypothetical protein [Myxococcales bacterium]
MFYLAPHPKLDRPRRGSPVMFTIPWVDKYFSRVRPWHVVTIWGPFTLYMLWRAGQSTGAAATTHGASAAPRASPPSSGTPASATSTRPPGNA